MESQAHREYALLAPVYDRVWRRYVQVSVEETLRHLPLNGDESVLDVGCGTGQLLERLAQLHPRLELHGLDQSEAMLKRARRRLGRRAAIIEGDARSLPYPDARFDLVISTSVLHYLPRPHQPVVVEWRRVLKPDGRLAITDWNRDHLGTRIREVALRRLARRQVAVLRHDDFVDLVDSAGLSATSHRRFSVGGWGLSAVVAGRRP